MTSDVDQFVESFRYQLLSYLRTRRFVGMLALTALIVAILVAFTLYQGSSGVRTAANGDVNQFLYNPLSFVGVLIVLAASFFGGDAIATDLGSATGYFTLVLPVRRSVLLLGRYAAAFAATFTLVLVMYGVESGLALWAFGRLSPEFALSLGIAALYVSAILALAFLLGAFFRRPVVALVATVLLVFFGFSIALSASEVFSVEPVFLANYGGEEIYNVVAPQPHITAVSAGGITVTTYNPTGPEAVAILLAYSAICLIGALLLFQRKEMTG